MRKMRTWREVLIERFGNSREEALGYLQASMECYQLYGDTAIFLEAVDRVVQSQGGVAELAKQTGLEPKVLAQLLSSDDALPLDTFAAILKALGCRLTIEPLAEAIPDIDCASRTEATRIENVA